MSETTTEVDVGVTEYEQVHVRVPKQTKELAMQELGHGGLTRRVREALARVAHGTETTELERSKDQLEKLRDQRREKMRERDDLNRELDQIEMRIERAEDRIDQLRDLEGEYEGMLAAMDERLAAGKRLFIGHGTVQRAATVGECTQEDVISDLKERNPDVPDDQFREKLHAGV